MHEPGKVLAFGAYELDLGRGELRRAGKAVEVQRTPLRVLLYLAEHRDRTVPRAELLDAIWPDVVVGDDSLTTALKEARHAVGDDGTTQRVIRTLKGAGVRFVAEVQAANGGSPVAKRRRGSPARGDARRARTLARPGVLLASLGALAAAVAAAWLPWREPARPPASASPHLLAVIPFRSVNADPALEAFAAALTAQVMDALQPPTNLIASATMRRFAGADPSADELIRATGATHALEATVQRDGERLRVIAQLHALRVGRVTWSRTYDPPGDGFLAAQDAVTNLLAQELPTYLPWVAASDPAKVEQIEEVARARGQIFAGDHEGAHSALMGVLARDPNDATAHQLLAFVWLNFGNHGKYDPREAVAKVKWHAAEAARAAPGSSDAHVAAAYASIETLDWATEEREARAACELDSSPIAWGCLALRHALLTQGRALEAMEVSRRQIDLFPYLAYPRVHFGLELLVARRYADAERQFVRAEQLGAYQAAGLTHLTRHLAGFPTDDAAHWRRQMGEAAAAELERVTAEGGERAGLRWIAAHGDRPNMVAFDDALVAAVAHALAGDRDDALSALENAPPHTDFAQYLLMPCFDVLRDEPRYRAIIEQLGLTAYHAKYLKRSAASAAQAPAR